MKTRQAESELQPKRGRGREALPPGQRRSVWIGAHVTEAKKADLQAAWKREKPGTTFASWLVWRIEGRPESAENGEKSMDSRVAS